MVLMAFLSIITLQRADQVPLSAKEPIADGTMADNIFTEIVPFFPLQASSRNVHEWKAQYEF